MNIGELTCGHIVEFKHNLNPSGEEEKCPECGKWFPLLHVWKDQWRSYCERGCPGRSHGLARVYAERAAMQHTARTGHRTGIRFYNDAPAAIRKRALRQTLSIPLPSREEQLALWEGEPPF